MILRALLLATLVTISTAAFGRTRAVQHPSSLPHPKSVLWIGAHPDDEAVVAPLLARWCRDEKAQCTMLILTRGESGACLLPEGCLPDVASVRVAEAEAAAAHFGATLIQLEWPDGGGSAAPAWNGELASTIAAVDPELILTFDPRHGTTCHPDHRETGRLVLEAADRLQKRPDVWLLETRVQVEPSPFSMRWSPAIPNAQRFDANATWDAVLEDMRRHPSQFDHSHHSAVDTLPPSQRAVYIAPSASALAQPVTTCP